MLSSIRSGLYTGAKLFYNYVPPRTTSIYFISGGIGYHFYRRYDINNQKQHANDLGNLFSYYLGGSQPDETSVNQSIINTIINTATQEVAYHFAPVITERMAYVVGGAAGIAASIVLNVISINFFETLNEQQTNQLQLVQAPEPQAQFQFENIPASVIQSIARQVHSIITANRSFTSEDTNTTEDESPSNQAIVPYRKNFFNMTHQERISIIMERMRIMIMLTSSRSHRERKPVFEVPSEEEKAHYNANRRWWQCEW